MAKLTGVDTGILLGAASGILGSFHASMPKPSDIRRASPENPDAVKDVRHSEVHALAAAGILGTLASLAVGNWKPLGVSLVVAGVMIGVNEWSLHSS